MRIATLGLLVVTSLARPAAACIWDGVTLEEERARHPALAEMSLSPDPPPADPAPHRERLRALEAAPRPDDPAWWNDRAGALIRSGDPAGAAALLEPLLGRFPNDYGLHANLGTAYHLLGRYAEAEREIARDLEIDPGAHFGLERWHLALLQYLVREPEDRAKRVYVDEWTEAFFNVTSPTDRFEPHHGTLTADRLRAEDAPAYRSRWNLAKDEKFEDGILYMASLNRSEPACWVVLGIAARAKKDYHLAAGAYRRAAAGGSPQAGHLTSLASRFEGYARESLQHRGPDRLAIAVLIVVGTIVAVVLVRLLRFARRVRS